MSAERTFDVVVVGAEPSGYAAAAVCAKAGLKAVVVPSGAEDVAPAYASRPRVSASVWRRFELHREGVVEAAAPARVSLGPDGRRVATFESAARTREAIEQVAERDARALDDFERALDRVRAAGARVRANGADPRFRMDALAETAPAAAAWLVRPYRDLVEAHFETPEIRGHYAAGAMSACVAGPAEFGAAPDFAAGLDAALWPVRDAGADAGLAGVLRAVAERSGGESAASVLAETVLEKSRVRLRIEDGDVIRAPHLVVASDRAALAAGLQPAAGARAPRRATEAYVRLKLSEPIDPPWSDAAGGSADGSVFVICDSLSEIQRAFDEAVAGSWSDRPPLILELSPDRREVFVRAPFAPRSFRDETGRRPWSEQDRQAFATRVVRRLSERLPGLDRSLRRTRIRVLEGPIDEDGVPRPPLRSPRFHFAGGSPGDIEAAVRIADALSARKA